MRKYISSYFLCNSTRCFFIHANLITSWVTGFEWWHHQVSWSIWWMWLVQFNRCIKFARYSFRVLFNKCLKLFCEWGHLVWLKILRWNVASKMYCEVGYSPAKKLAWLENFWMFDAVTGSGVLKHSVLLDPFQPFLCTTGLWSYHIQNNGHPAFMKVCKGNGSEYAAAGLGQLQSSLLMVRKDITASWVLKHHAGIDIICYSKLANSEFASSLDWGAEISPQTQFKMASFFNRSFNWASVFLVQLTSQLLS